MPEPRAIVPDSSVRGKKNAAVTAIPNRRFVKPDAANGVDAVALAAAATDVLLGVTMEAIAANGGMGDVQTTGVAIVQAGAAVAIGARVTSDGTGRAVTWAPGAGVNHSYGGVANSAAAAADELIEVELSGPGQVGQGA